MKQVLFVFFLSLGVAQAQSLPSKAFLLGIDSDFVSKSCEILSECDCCYAELVLISDTRFVIFDRCLTGDAIFVGSYSVKASVLTLTFGPQFVLEEVDEEYEVSKRNLKKCHLKTVKYIIQPCLKSTILAGTDEYYEYGVPQPAAKALKLQSEVAKSLAVKMLL